MFLFDEVIKLLKKIRSDARAQNKIILTDQRSLTDQMFDLYDIARHVGMQDAADYIQHQFMTQTK